MHRCEECGAPCDCGGDITPETSAAPQATCSHCAYGCDHGVSFNATCDQCNAEIHAAEDQIDAAEQQRPPLSQNGGW